MGCPVILSSTYAICAHVACEQRSNTLNSVNSTIKEPQACSGRSTQARAKELASLGGRGIFPPVPKSLCTVAKATVS